MEVDNDDDDDDDANIMFLYTVIHNYLNPYEKWNII